MELVEVIMNSEVEEDPTQKASEVRVADDSARKRGRPPGSGPDSGTKASSSEGHRCVASKMKRAKTDLDDSEWELQQNPKRRGKYLKKPKILASRAELGLTAKQWQAVRSKVELFEVNSVPDITAEAVRQLDLAERARSKSKNIKGDLNNFMKIGIVIAKHAVHKIAERVTDGDDLEMTSKDRILSLMRERDDLQKEDLR